LLGATRKRVVSLSARVVCIHGLGWENYVLGHSKVTLRRLKEMGSLRYFPTSHRWAARAETMLRPDGEFLVFEGLFVPGLWL
jgi:hypothetical protein